MSEKADLFIPDSISPAEAQARTSHLGIGAHQDDLEFMAFHGISTCYDQEFAWFGGITCTNGGGSVRSSAFADKTDEAMMAIRAEEQRRAARLGKYSFMAQLGFASACVKNPKTRNELVDELERYLLLSQPEVVYTHNPADRHPTHIAVFQSVVEAARRISPCFRPKKVYGCEVWRDLDWLDEQDKIALDVSGHPDLARKLNACFESQISGGKDYGKAVIGRRHANATFRDSHGADTADQLWFAMDLTSLIEEECAGIDVFVKEKLERFNRSVLEAL